MTQTNRVRRDHLITRRSSAAQRLERLLKVRRQMAEHAVGQIKSLEAKQGKLDKKNPTDAVLTVTKLREERAYLEARYGEIARMETDLATLKQRIEDNAKPANVLRRQARKGAKRREMLVAAQRKMPAAETTTRSGKPYVLNEEEAARLRMETLFDQIALKRA